MRAVVDTNVLVSGLLGCRSAPARVVEFLFLGRLAWLYDLRILGEYREVLSRPKFSHAIHPDDVEELGTLLERVGECVFPAPGAFPQAVSTDRDDLPFIEVALAGKADCIITGNMRHFAGAGTHVRILTPAQCLELLCG